MIYFNLRLENYLVYNIDELANNQLCDFEGSTYKELSINSGHLLDDPFFNSKLASSSISTINVFNLISILYTILIGYWSHRTLKEF